ncbi:protoporphyrinogen oxidase, mitochondrial [Macadamia integrifolia]|uniref:protoporphyrinogen oxidase, mitochondrial n=1 Tax=Macadamia integrifolia TaxID=60698 RepID=UPI001C4EF427|nr:protoporphyrinogen oxidase, mitochondrial [Macadamia integrifolia]
MAPRAPTIKEDKTIERPVKSVAVVGAGVSGLAAAFRLKSHGLDVKVFEAEERAGGKLRSVSKNGLIWDEGANTMTESEIDVKRLLDDLGLRVKQQFPISQNNRYIVRNGRPELIPSDPISLIKTNFLSTQSKLQIILEPFLRGDSLKKSNISKVSDENLHESVGEFFQRHFGKEVVDYLVDPFVAGSSGGDPESLSIRHAFPELWNLERKLHLSDCTLTDTLCNVLGEDNMKLKSKVLSLSYNHDVNSASNNWSISYATKHSRTSQHQSFDAIIVTAPLSDVKEMKIARMGNPFLLDFLPVVNYLPISVVITTFKKEKVQRPLEGFGVLVPSKEQQNGLKTLGTLFSSMMFPDRAPSDLYLYTTFVGGSRNRDLAKASLDELKHVVTSDLRKLLGAEGEPTFVNCFHWSKAFPLYGHGYDSVLKAIDKMEESLPGFFYAGNHRGGLSVGKSIASGCKAADLVISNLNSLDGSRPTEENS